MHREACCVLVTERTVTNFFQNRLFCAKAALPDRLIMFYFALAAFLSPRKPIDVTQISLSKIINMAGKNKMEAISIAHKTSMPSIISSGLSFFAATFGVSCYSQVEMIGREIDLKIIIMIRKMAPMEITFTRTRSASVVS